jgi:hypothetical protein
MKVAKAKLERARTWAEAYVKARTRFNPRVPRTNGRLPKNFLVRY